MGPRKKMEETTQPFEPDANLEGKMVGRFTVKRLVAAGGMGEVYLGEDPTLHRLVAIKRLAPRLRSDLSYRKRLLREAQRTSELHHPRVATVFDVIEQGNELFLVMEYIDGVTLRERMEEGPITLEQFWTIAIQITEGLAVAHRRGIIHGDLKPENVMLTSAGSEVKLCDFGIAQRVDMEGSNPANEETRDQVQGKSIVGTPSYLSPEALLGQPVEAPADIFSLGIVFYEILSERHPFRTGGVLATSNRILHETPASLNDPEKKFPDSLVQVVSRMLEKNPSARYPNADVLLQDLLAARSNSRIQSRHWWRILAATGVAALLSLLLVFAFLHSGLNRRQTNIPKAKNLMILPFRTIGTDPNMQFYADGMSETLNARLSELTIARALQVVPYTEVRSRKVSSIEGARNEFGANLLLNGTLQFSGDLVRATCVLIDTVSGHQLRSQTVTVSRSNVFLVQDRVVEAAVQMLEIELKAGERKSLAFQGSQQPGANDFYLQAKGYLLNFEHPENIENAIALFRRSLDIDPGFGEAYAGLGEAYWRKFEATKMQEWVDSARQSCTKATSLNADAPTSHSCLGTIFSGTGQYERAIDEFQRALELDATNDVLYIGLANAYERANQVEQAEQTFRRAIALRPHYWGGYHYLGVYYFRHSSFDNALRMFQQVVQLVPDSFRGYANLGGVYLAQGKHADAIQAFQKSLAIRPNYPAASNLGTAYFFQGQYPQSAASYRQALQINASDYVVWGNLAAALKWSSDRAGSLEAYRKAKDLADEQKKLDSRNPALLMNLAEYNAALGNTAAAVPLLQQALILAPKNAEIEVRAAVVFEEYLGRRSDALHWIAEAVMQGYGWKNIEQSPGLSRLLNDPAFQQLRRQN